MIVRKDDNGLIARRTFNDLRRSILISLVSGQKTVNQISRHTKINWRSVVIHIKYLVEKGLIKNVVNSPYVKIYELSDIGKEFIALLGINLEKSADKKFTIQGSTNQKSTSQEFIIQKYTNQKSTPRKGKKVIKIQKVNES